MIGAAAGSGLGGEVGVTNGFSVDRPVGGLVGFDVGLLVG